VHAGADRAKLTDEMIDGGCSATRRHRKHWRKGMAAMDDRAPRRQGRSIDLDGVKRRMVRHVGRLAGLRGEAWFC
jgi:hypothetical protein